MYNRLVEINCGDVKGGLVLFFIANMTIVIEALQEAVKQSERFGKRIAKKVPLPFENKTEKPTVEKAAKLIRLGEYSKLQYHLLQQVDPSRWPSYLEACDYLKKLPLPPLRSLSQGGASIISFVDALYFELVNSFSLPVQNVLKQDNVPKSKPFQDVGLWHQTHQGNPVHTLFV
jgi:hypothetical protein